MLDVILATLHHLIVFGLVAVVFAELVYVRPGMDIAAVKRLARLDAFYGILAGLIVFIGFGRAMMAAKGWEYYTGNLFFWAKIATFVVIGLLSIQPTISYIKWRKAGVTPSDEAVAKARRFLLLETLLFAPLLFFAAAMARGYSLF